MPNFLMPDIPGQYQRGKEFKATNRMNDIALTRAETQMGQEQRVNNILGRLPNARPEEQMQIRNSLAAQGDPGMRAMQNLQNLDAGQREAELHKAQQVGRTLISANAENYPVLRQEIAKFAPMVAQQLPEQFDPEIIGGYVNRLRSVESMLGGGSNNELETFGELTKNFTPEEKLNAARYKMGLRARPTEAITLAGDEDLAGRVTDVQSGIAGEKAGASETAKLEAQLDRLPEVKRQVRLAEEEAKSRGEALSEVEQARAAMPGLVDVVDTLKELAPQATYTMGGRAWDALVRETGFGATKGATARAKFIAIINNQVLPLLKPTFGAAFTVEEGKALRDTMGDPNMQPEVKMAVLDAFIQQKYRNLEAKGSEAGVEIDVQALADEISGASRETTNNQTIQEGQTATNPQTGERIIYQNGQWQPAP